MTTYMLQLFMLKDTTSVFLEASDYCLIVVAYCQHNAIVLLIYIYISKINKKFLKSQFFVFTVDISEYWECSNSMDLSIHISNFNKLKQVYEGSTMKQFFEGS